MAAIFCDLGAALIDADQIVHEMLAPGGMCVTAIGKHFGAGVLENGGVNRRALAKIVFYDQDLLKELEAIIHPEVKRIVQDRIRAIRDTQPERVIVLDVPLLYEAKMEHMVDMSIVVHCKQDQQILRAIEALQITKQDALLRIQSQMPLVEKIKLADVVIDNTGKKMELINEVKG
ncbi:MAG: dephospho-CoA kinase, partial [Candidatus Omnitrophica bacterium]|nr:dephospho-CoA kinase [Candidatus Omnitrophota bacterium]